MPRLRWDTDDWTPSSTIILRYEASTPPVRFASCEIASALPASRLPVPVSTDEAAIRLASENMTVIDVAVMGPPDEPRSAPPGWPLRSKPFECAPLSADARPE